MVSHNGSANCVMKPKQLGRAPYSRYPQKAGEHLAVLIGEGRRLMNFQRKRKKREPNICPRASDFVARADGAVEIDAF